MKNVISKKRNRILLLATVFLMSCVCMVLATIKSKEAYASTIPESTATTNNYTYLVGNVTLEEGIVKVRNPQIPEISLGDYEFYYVTDGVGQQYYVADITSVGENYLDYGIGNIRIFDKDSAFNFSLIEEFTELNLGNKYVLELQFFDEPANFLYSIYSIISYDIYNFLTFEAVPISITGESTDILSLKLREFIEFEHAFKTQFTSKEPPQIVPMQAVPSGLRLLDYDGIVNEYFDLYAGQNHFTQGQSTSDNSIVNIIPKGDFKYSRTNKLVVGKEYGYYIRSTSINTYDISSNILVFDIENSIPNPAVSTGSVSVKPLFGGTYYYDWSRDIVSWDNNSGGFGTRLCLANIKLNLGLTNAHHNGAYVRNPGDTGYNPYDDKGYYFGDYDFYTCGVGRARDENTFDATILKTILRKVKYVKYFASPVLSVFENIDESFSKKPYEDQGFNVSKNSGVWVRNVRFNESNLWNFIDTFHHAPKGMDISISNQSVRDGYQHPILYKPFNPNHEFTVKYNTNQFQPNVNIDGQLTTAVTVDIVEDNSGRGFLWIPYGQVDYITTGSYAFSEEFNRRPDAERPVFQMYESELYRADLREGMYQDFKFIPNNSNRYVFETIGDYDVHLTLLDANKNYIYSDDDSGYNANARLPYNLVGGTTYYVRVKIYDFASKADFGTTKVFVRKEVESKLEESTRTAINKSTVSFAYGDVIWRTFIPKSSGIYTFTSLGGDTCLQLYDQEFNRLAVNDDNRYGTKAIIDFYLKAGQEYHIRTEFYYSSSGNLSLVVNRLLAMSFDETDSVSEYFSFDAGGFAYYRIRPRKSGTYIMGATASSSYKDTYIHLYDENYNQIAYDDDSGSGLTCMITYNLQANKTYYIRVRAFSSTEACSGRAIFYLDY